MNYSIYSADRATHLKIVVVALCVVIAVAGLALSLRDTSSDGSVHAERMRIIKAGKPVMETNSRGSVVHWRL
jgi:hypothetical protein